MRQSTLKILLLTYGFNQETLLILPKYILRECLPELSDSGFRSLLYYLSSHQLIELQKTEKHISVIATSTGNRYIEHLYPWLAQTPSLEVPGKEAGELLIFKQGRSSDPQFRRLRRLSLENGGMSITRGVYFFLVRMPHGLMHELMSRYRQHVVVMKVEKMEVGNISGISLRESVTKELLEISSGISRELTRLTGLQNTYSKLNYQQKAQFFSLFNQIIDLFGETRGKNMLPSTLRDELVASMQILHEVFCERE